MFAIQPDDPERLHDFVEDVHGICGLNEFCPCWFHVDADEARGLAVVYPGIGGSLELVIGSGRRLLRHRFLERPWLVWDVRFLPSHLAADIRNADALADSAPCIVETPRSG